MSTDTLRFDNRFIGDLPGDEESGPRVREVRGAAWSAVLPTPVADPQLLAYSQDVANLLGFGRERIDSPDFPRVFGGNALYAGMQPWAANYGGHQFGHWAGQLGDGRAISLGELIGAGDARWELQLKGAGRTPYSRGADGRAVLRSSIREFLCSEAMHHLGVPTTRALSLVGSGDSVVRDMFYDGNARPEPGAIVCRVAPSFIRFGTFELPASRGDTPLLRQLADTCIARDFPALCAAGPARYAQWFAQICARTAEMVAHWMRVGFVHGVMNTDNMSILGLTIDYGPYGWVEDYDPDWTPNTTDAQGRRYRFGTQPQVAYWNLTRLAQALAPLFDDVTPLHDGLAHFQAVHTRCERDDIAAKFGLAQCGEDDVAMMAAWLQLLQEGEMDMTLAFRGLMALDAAAPSVDVLDAAFYSAARRQAVLPTLQAWVQQYAARVRGDGLEAGARQQRMARANPLYVLRNWLAQEAIEQAEQGDLSGVHTLLEVLRRPYDPQTGREHYAGKRPDWARDKAGCSQLSCSS